jgi:hypothetical protein
MAGLKCEDWHRRYHINICITYQLSSPGSPIEMRGKSQEGTRSMDICKEAPNPVKIQGFQVRTKMKYHSCLLYFTPHW